MSRVILPCSGVEAERIALQHHIRWLRGELERVVAAGTLAEAQERARGALAWTVEPARPVDLTPVLDRLAEGK